MARHRSLVVFFAVAVSSVAQQRNRFDYPQLLGRLTDANWLFLPPVVGERCVQFSSYDRASDRGPADAVAWYGNDDRGHCLRVEERAGQREFVLADIDGPGVVARLWSANPSGTLHLHIDGERVWSVDFAELCSGQMWPAISPLAGVRSGGANCHLPIPFQKRLKISATASDLCYQIHVLRFAPGTSVPSFRPAMLQTHVEEIASVASELRERRPRQGLSYLVAPGAWATAHEVPRRWLVRDLFLQVKRPTAAVDLGEVLRRVLLVVHCGKEETVRVPVLDFFGGGADWRRWRISMLEILDTGSASCSWPMPMPDGGRVELVAEGDLHGVEARLGLQIEPGPISFVEPMLFRASWHQRKGLPSRPFHDHTVLDAKGSGRFVGCSLLVKNPARAWWGEGDEKFAVDGEPFPSTFGTGTDDYFGYAAGSPQLFQSPFHAQVQCDGPGNYGFTAAHRSHQLDAVPFLTSFRFDLEVLHPVADLKLDYATVAYWYGAPGATSGLPPVPPVAERSLERLPPLPVFVAKDALEGEKLRVVSCSGGEHRAQDLGFVENTFSRDAQLWWQHGGPGDTLVLAVRATTAGEFSVTAAFCKAEAYGIVKLTLNGQPLGEPFDGYAPQVSTSGPLDLGVHTLVAGDNELRIAIHGRNELAKPGHMFGLDYLQLRVVR